MVDKDPKQGQDDSGNLSKTQVIHDFKALDSGTLLVGRFQIEKLQGIGRFGAVYKALDLQLEVAVAIKVLHPLLAEDRQVLSRFKQEILLLRQLSHPNIVRVHEYYADNELHFLTMDWIEGESLDARLTRLKQQKQSLSSKQLGQYIQQLTSALIFAEENKVLHRDLKPENILIDEQEQLYIADFGLATFAEATSAGVITGTPYYAPPEYLQKNETNSTTDLYALGVILYELCCFKLPFEAQNLSELIAEKFSGNKRFPAIDNSLKRYKQIVLRLIAPYPQMRYSSAHALQEALDFNLIKQAPEFTKSKHFSWLAALMLVILAGWFWWQYRVQTHSLGQHRAIAIVPFTTQDLSRELSDWIRYGIPDYLHYQLSQNPQLRLVDNERVLQTLDLLGYQPPLNDNQLLFIAELLQVDAILGGRIISQGQQQELLALYSITISGNTLSKTAIAELPVSEQSVDRSIEQLVTDISEKLNLQQQITGHSGSQFLQHTSIQRLLKEQQWQQAQREINQLLLKQPKSEQLWFALAEAHLNQGNIQQAEQALVKVQTLTPASSFLHLQASALLNELAEKYEEAEAAYLLLAEAFPLNLEVKFSLSELYITTQQFAKAEQVLKQVVELDPNHPRAWFEMAKVAIWSGDTQLAVDDYLVKALVIAKKLKDIHLEGDVLNAMGVAYQRLGNLELALDYYQQGLKKRTEAGNQADAATTMTNLASVHSVQGQHQEATDYLQQSISIYESIGDIAGQSYALNELGILAEEQGDYEQALEHYRQALTLRIQLGDEWSQAESMNNIGFIYYLLTNPENALVYWKQAEQIYQKLQDPVGVIRVRENLGQMELAMGNWRNAFFIFEKALQDSQQLGLLEETLVAEVYLAKLGFLQGNFEQSIAKLESLYQQLDGRNDIRGIIEFGLWLADWYSLTANQQQLEQQLNLLSPLIADKASAEQQFYYQTLRLRADDNLYSDINLSQQFSQTNIPEATQLRYLLDKANHVLQHDQQQFPQLVKQIKNYDLTLHQYEHIYLLELEATYYYINQDWTELEQRLNAADQLMRKMGDYWRSFQLSRLRAVLSEKQGKPSQIHRQRAQQQLNHLLKQLPEDNRRAFLQQQNRVAFNDDLMEMDFNDE